MLEWFRRDISLSFLKYSGDKSVNLVAVSTEKYSSIQAPQYGQNFSFIFNIDAGHG